MLPNVKCTLWITTLSLWRLLNNSMNLWAMVQGHPSWTDIEKVLTIIHKSLEENGNPFHYSCHKTLLTAQKGSYDTRIAVPRIRMCPIHLQGKKRGQLLIAPERTKCLSQSRKETQSWMSGDERKVQCCKERCCIGIRNSRSMNQANWPRQVEMQVWTSTS